MNKYESLPSVTRESAEYGLKSAKGEDLCRLLLSLSELPDWEWVQEIYLKYINHDDRWVASAAITGLGHLARNAGKLDKSTVVDCLKEVAEANAGLEGKVQDALSDIDVFL